MQNFFCVICDRALLEMLEFGNSFTNNIQSKVDVGLIKPYRKHLLIKRCDCFTCLQFDCRKMSYCSQLTQRTVVVLFLSFCIFFIVCQRTILVSTFYGWYNVCIRWGVRKKLNIVWLAKHYLIWHGQLSRRRYILSLAFAFVCRAQFNAQEWKRDRERERVKGTLWQKGRKKESV